MSLSGKSVVVTGGASGMGEACASLIASRGARIAIGDIQSDRGESVVGRIRSAGGSAFFSRTDVTLRPDVDTLFARALAEHGRIDVLVHAAGVATSSPFVEVSEEHWGRILHANLDATFYCNQAAVRIMLRQRGGRIINFASIAGAVPRARMAAYSAAKAGVVALTRSIQNEHAGDDIALFAIAPGATDTPMLRQGRSAEELARIERRTKFGKVIQPQQVAELVAFIADDITGHMLAGQVFHTNGAEFFGS